MKSLEEVLREEAMAGRGSHSLGKMIGLGFRVRVSGEGSRKGVYQRGSIWRRC